TVGREREPLAASSAAQPWWCRVDSNHRQRDYESRALPPELRHRRDRELSERPESAPSACASSSGASRWLHAFSCSFPCLSPDEHESPRGLGSGWLRSLDSNQGPSGYEPDELPLLHSAVPV